MRYRGTTALVTGASSGIGREFAATLAARGADLVVTARRTERLEELATELRRDHGVRVTVLPADLSRPRAGATLRDALAARGIRVSTLINCAGLGGTSALTEAGEDAVHDLVMVNVTALTDLTRAFLPEVLDAGDGAIVNIASLVGHVPVPGMAVYAAGKAYVISFTEALAYELRDSPVRVLLLTIGSTRSEFFAASGTIEEGVRFQTPAQVVATGMRALDAGRPPTEVVSGTINRVNLAVMRRLPRRLALTLAARAARPA
ncbi:SDR family NAD(P)-dependent oxidoreductase [Catenuloplanes japonicus]|uniref:SDR family NAD(P)-dependent oxidoreductase n=1 Tax=Catenuloplanes japonicus TaxID=33876 RepID=UPI0005269756|nr:SDR family oxidoreductase [Catenuloplanes japonicus]